MAIVGVNKKSIKILGDSGNLGGTNEHDCDTHTYVHTNTHTYTHIIPILGSE